MKQTDKLREGLMAPAKSNTTRALFKDKLAPPSKKSFEEDEEEVEADIVKNIDGRIEKDKLRDEKQSDHELLKKLDKKEQENLSEEERKEPEKPKEGPGTQVQIPFNRQMHENEDFNISDVDSDQRNELVEIER